MKQNLRIALVTGSLSHHGYGVRSAVELLSAELAQLGHEVMVFGLRDPDWETNDSQLWRGATPRALSFYGPENFGFTPALTREVLAFAPDIVHINGLWMYSSVVAPKIARRSGAKLVISPHGMLAGVALDYASLKKRIAMVSFQRSCFKAADGFHATAQAEQLEIEKVFPKSLVRIVPNGLRVLHPGDVPMKERQNKVVAIGRMHHVKGYDLLLHAWQAVEPNFLEWELEIRGPSAGGYAEHLSTLAGDLGLTRVTIGGALDEQERDRLISMSKLFVLSSRNENFALTVPEALLCSTPVLASRATPWAGLEANACGWWVDGRPKGLAEGLSQALAIDDAEREAMGRRGRNWVESEFSAKKVAKDMENFYVALIDGGQYPEHMLKHISASNLNGAY